jgi:CheY-like chemotaxis protein
MEPENQRYIGKCDLRSTVTTPPQILIVEDDADTRDALWALLEKHGYSVALAANGADGLSRLRGGLRPSLILLDLMMPEKNGFQFRVEQVADPVLADIPVVIYSGNPEAKADGAVLGGVACLTKPIDVDKLLQVVKAHC